MEPTEAMFAVGDRVEKITGDYRLAGEVRAVLTTSSGKVRIVVEHAADRGGFLHIYAPSNLRLVEAAPHESGERVHAPFVVECLRDYAQLLRDGTIDGAGRYLPEAIEAAADVIEDGAKPAIFDLVAHIVRQRVFSERTFGPGVRTAGVCDHIRKELTEIEKAPRDLEEWVDVILLAIDGAWRSGASAIEIVAAMDAKQTKNERRDWPDWRTADPDKAIEHVRAHGGDDARD